MYYNYPTRNRDEWGMSLGFKGANRVDMSLNLKTAINNAKK